MEKTKSTLPLKILLLSLLSLSSLLPAAALDCGECFHGCQTDVRSGYDYIDPATTPLEAAIRISGIVEAAMKHFSSADLLCSDDELLRVWAPIVRVLDDGTVPRYQSARASCAEDLDRPKEYYFPLEGIAASLVEYQSIDYRTSECALTILSCELLGLQRQECA